MKTGEFYWYKKGEKMGLDYKKSGVDVEAGYMSVKLIRDMVASTRRKEVLGDLGGFSGAFDMSGLKDMKEPVLLSGTDGVGTKLKLAFVLDKHDTIGIDAVAMCVNDVACAGGEPLFFLDYIACGKNYPDKIAQIVKGVAEGCRQAGAALIGGETAEHPGLMPENEYDVAGFAVGVVEKSEIIDGSSIVPGDVLIGVSSSGVHSNGFSLIRRIVGETRQDLDIYEESLGKTIGEELLTPTRIYTGMMSALKKKKVVIKGCSHITGGGFYENIPRMLPDGIRAMIRKDSYKIPPVFELLRRKGELSEEVLYGTFNMGLGMLMAVSADEADRAMDVIRSTGNRCFIVGSTTAGERGVSLL